MRIKECFSSIALSFFQTYESECSYSSEELEEFQNEVKHLQVQMKQLKVRAQTKRCSWTKAVPSIIT